MMQMIRRGLAVAGAAGLVRRGLAGRRRAATVGGPATSATSATSATASRRGFGVDDVIRRLPGLLRRR